MKLLQFFMMFTGFLFIFTSNSENIQFKKWDYLSEYQLNK